MIYQLKIVSWADRSNGYQSGATHYMGSIRMEGSRERFDLEHEVEILHPEYADSSLRCMQAKPGEMMTTCRFLTREDVRKAARKWMKENAKPGDTLVEI